MLKIVFNDNNKPLALALGRALTEYAAGLPVGKLGGEPVEPEKILQAVAEDELATLRAETTNSADPTAEADPTRGQPVEDGEEDPARVAEAKADCTATRDSKGVRFNDNYCANAADPFYSSGKRAGQWKKKRGVGDETYDTWYASCLSVPAADVDSPVDAGAAFSSPEDSDEGAPTTGGELMTWVSEQQVAGNISQADFRDACQAAGVGIHDIYQGDDIAGAVAKVYQALKGA